MNYDESNDMTAAQIWALLDDWEWDSLTGRFQDYIIASKKERAEMLEALKVAYDAIKSLPLDCMGSGHDGELEWPIRDEVLDKLAHAIAKARGES